MCFHNVRIALLDLQRLQDCLSLADQRGTASASGGVEGPFLSETRLTKDPRSPADPSGRADPSWRTWPWSPHHALPVHRTPLRYFVERLQRRQPFSFARLDSGFGSPVGAAATRLVCDVEVRFSQLPAPDPGWFVGADATPGEDPAEIAALGARLASVLPTGCIAQDGALFRRATLDGSIRALLATLRHQHVVAVGPARLAELGERLRLPSFRLEAVSRKDAVAQRHSLGTEIEEGHRVFRGEPVVYLFHAGLVAAEWVLSLHGRLRNAFLIDVGTALDACVSERILRGPWGAIHWQAVARHLGLDPGPSETLSGWDSFSHDPQAAPARTRSSHTAPTVERRRLTTPPLGVSSASSETSWQRLRDGDLEKCLHEVLTPRTQS